MDEDWEFKKGDLRRNADPKFQGETFKKHLEAVNKLDKYATEELDQKVINLAVRWILDKGVDSAIWGARKPEQVTFDEVAGWKLTDEQIEEIENIVEETVKNPISPAFMAPPE
jgi:aryl-alcohol dehydrogenase-like predicted oxidoreductase